MLGDDHYHDMQSKLFDALEAGGIATAVPLRARYIGVARCLTVLAFVPTTVATAIGSRLIRPLRAAGPSHHFYSPGDLHVTVKNVRRASEVATYTCKDIAIARRVLVDSIRRLPRFTFRLRGLLLLPGSIAVRAYATPSYVSVVNIFDDALRSAGIPDDKVYQSTDIYFGNVTICRYTSPPDDLILKRADDLRSLDLGELSVSQLHLVECDEVCSQSSRLLHATARIGCT